MSKLLQSSATLHTNMCSGPGLMTTTLIDEESGNKIGKDLNTISKIKYKHNTALLNYDNIDFAIHKKKQQTQLYHWNFLINFYVYL